MPAPTRGARAVCAAAALVAVCAERSSALQMQLWPNAGAGGAPEVSTVDGLASLTWPPSLAKTTFSALILGSFTPPYDGSRWNISCDIAGVSAFLYLDDHLVCQGGNDPATWSGYRAETAVPWPGTPSTTEAKLPYFVRLRVVHIYNESDPAEPTFSMRFSPLHTGVAPMEVPPPAPAPVPASAFENELQPAQVQRLNMSRWLVHGRWSTWAKQSVTAPILLPTGLMLRLGLCQVSSKSCKEDGQKSDIDSGQVRLGPHAYDHSYTQLYFAFNGANVSFETSQLGGEPGADLVVSATPVGDWNRSDFALVAIPVFTNEGVDQASWRLPGAVAVDSSGTGTFTATPGGKGLDVVTVHGAQGQAVSAVPFDVRSPQYLAWQFPSSGGSTSGAVCISTSRARTVAEVAAAVASARSAEYKRYAAFGDLAEAAEASQAVMMWNMQWSPDIPGAYAPVSRGWGRPWVIFDWDCIFGAYQLSIGSKELAYSQLAAVIKTKTAEGMVPNFWQPQQISYDRTEPIIGAKVLHEIHKKWGDDWIVELLYGDLYDWIAWFFRERRESPLGLICLGSTPGLPTTDTANMQAARYESGLDNSPMYDGEFFNTTTNHMQLYDVGMSSMVAMELKALADLSLTAFNPPKQKEHYHLMSLLSELSGLIQAHLWDDESSIFVNKFSTNGTFYRRISPTSFYPMQAGIATEQQATAMVQNWLMSPKHFCVSPHGDFKGNSEDCYWGLPSIQASDPAFPPLGYWRGYVWGPMIQLTYWALSAPEYAHLDVVNTGRKALAKQTTAMLMNQWHLNRHVCENFSPHHNATDCTGDRLYTWGGLAGFVSLLEAGYY